MSDRTINRASRKRCVCGVAKRVPDGLSLVSQAVDATAPDRTVDPREARLFKSLGTAPA